MATKLKFSFKQHRHALELSIERHEKRKAAWLEKQPKTMNPPEYPEQYVIDRHKEAITIFKNLEYTGTPDASVKAKSLTLDLE